MKSGQKNDSEFSEMDLYLEDPDIRCVKMPTKEDFCYLLMGRKSLIDVPPGKPVPIGDLNLCHFHVAAVEHTRHLYRLYHYGSISKGVFRGDDTLVCESIPIEDEKDKFSGFLLYNEDGFQSALKDYNKYQDWIKNRNEARWTGQDGGAFTYDAKNMMHCARLLLSGEHILRRGSPIVRFEGKQRDFLMEIRRGERPYEDIMEWVNRKMAFLEGLYNSDKCAVPNKVDIKKIEELYKELST